MENVTNLSDVSVAHQETIADPLEEILSFYSELEDESDDQEVNQEPNLENQVKTHKINFSHECQKLIASIERAQKRSDFYLSEILSFTDDDD